MELVNKGWLDILGRNSDYHGDPLIILDESFEIIYTNQKASSLFAIDDIHITLEQVFEQDTVQKLNDFIGPAFNSFQKKLFTNTSVKLKSGNTLSFDLSIEPILTNEDKNVILVFRNLENINFNDLLNKIIIRSAKNNLNDGTDDLQSLITELQKLAPFTLVSLRRVQNLIDKYNYPIWIKDVESRLLSINTAYSNILGIETNFAAGKKHETFLPPHQKDIYKILDQYIIHNRQQIILEGFSRKNKNFQSIKTIIQFPILDNFNKILALVGLIVDNNYDYYNLQGKEEFFNKLIDNLPYPAALITSDALLKYSNHIFGELFNLDPEKISGSVVNKRIEEILPLSISDNVNSFIKSDLRQDQIFLPQDFKPADFKNNDLQLFLIKISSEEILKSDILLTIGEQKKRNDTKDELQNILMHRGTMFDILIQRNPEPIFVYDKENLKFLEVNQAAIKLYGYTHEEFLQMDLTDLYAPEDIQTLLDSFGDESSESRFTMPFRHRKKDGSTVLVEISKTSFKFNDREAHFNIVKDITDSVEKDKQTQMLKTIFNQTDLMVFNTDASGFIKYVNLNVTKNTGYNIDELLQSSFASLVSDDDRGIINMSIFQSHLKDTVVIETNIKQKLGNQFQAKITATPIFDFNGEIDSFTIVGKPLYVLSNETAPKEIVREVIKEVFVEKPVSPEHQINIPDSNFLSGMFHEILTPINVIIGFSQELISSNENPTEEQIEAADIINQNRIKMMDTMNAVVEYSDIMQNRSRLNIDEVTITDIIEKLDENIKDITGINDIQFSYGKISSSLKFKSDKHKLENFILSLIKVVSRLSKDKKIYFSAFSVESDLFIVGISDQYGNPSEYVTNVLEEVFINNKDPKDFGLPKLTTYLARILLKFLGGKYYRSSSETLRKETGFIFPIELLPVSDIERYNSLQELISSIHTPSEIAESDLQKKSLVDSRSTLESNMEEGASTVDEKKTDDSNDIFKPVQPISQELLSKIDSDKNVDDNLIENETQTFIDSDKIKSEESTVANSDEIESQDNLSEEIKNEITSEIKDHLESQPALNLTGLKCLYIEDQVDSQILFKVQMKELKDVKFAVSFEEAQLLLLNHQFDFIVMDINLQGEYNGLDALKIIKTMPAFSSIPIIAVTAYVLPGDKEKFIAAGFDDFISKPIFKEKMIESLEKIFLAKY
ncbi:MAG TPA: hypothetical protein DHV28_10940 [Ignavibacteriales bacterium]|nr:hypothetical protein [Ignavibacteriales bacterium]